MNRAALSLILLAGAALRLWGLGRDSLWHDESWTWGLVQEGPARMLGFLAREDAHPPLYFLLMSGWAKFGSAEFWLRLPSALAGIASILLIFRLGRRLGGERAGLGAALFLALSPYAVRYSQEARSYALLFLLCLAALDALLDVRDFPDSRAWIRLGVLAGAIVLTHYLGLLFLVALGAAIPIWGGFPRRPLLLAGLLSLAVFSPWFVPAFHHVRLIESSFWLPAPTLRGVAFSLGELIAGSAAPGFALPFLLIPLALPFVLRSRDFAAWLLLAALPPLFELLLSLRRPIFYTQTFQYSLIPLFVASALGCARLSLRTGAVAAALLALPLVPGLVRHHARPYKEDWRGAAARLAQHPGEPVILVPGYTGISLEYYGGRPDTLRLLGAGDMLRQKADEAALREELKRSPAVWLVWRYEERPSVPNDLMQGFREDAAWEGNGVRLRRWIR